MLRALTLLLALAATPLAAQPPADADTTRDDQPPAASPAPAPAASPAPAPAATAGGATGGSKRDPSDYEASEQISEDLSVSFPVDI